MSKFQSFATQGSFRDYQLQAPDETAKIEQETARTIRGRERAQQFLEQNNELYLRAQKLAQNQESAQREQNFQLETENRKAFRDALDRDFNVQTENDRIRAAQLDQTFKQLSAFSKTAFELYGQVDQQITEKQEKANAANTIIAGTTVQENSAIKGMVSNLTRAEFEQQDLITNLVKEGKDVDALWSLYGRRNTRGFINNASSVQNSAFGLDSYLNQVILNLPEDITAQQRKLEVDKAYRTFLADNLTVDGKQINPKLINNIAGPILNSAYNRVSGELDREIRKEHLETLRQDKIKGLNVLWDSGNGVQGVLEEYHTKNPSQDKREILAEWVVSRLKSGTLSPEEASAILDTEYDGPNGKPTSWRQQFSASKEVGIINEAIRDQRRVNVGEVALRENEQKIATELKIQQKLDEFIADGDGIFSPEELAAIEALQEEGPPGYQSPALEEARKLTVSAQEATLLNKEFETRANNLNLKVSDVLSIKGNYALVQKWLPIAKQQEDLRSAPENKTDINAIKAKLAQDPRIKAAPVTGAENYSVILMQERFIRQYKATLARTGDPNQARAATITAIENLQKNPQSITNGFYTEIIQQEKAGAAAAKTSLKKYQDLLKASVQPDFRTNPKKALNVIGVENYTQARQAMSEGREPTALIKQGAELFNVSPLEFINFLSKGKGDKPITLNSQLESIRSQIKPSTRRFYNVTRTNERIIRGSLIDSGQLPTAPRRGSFGPSQSSNLSDPVLRRAADITSNYESAGAGGYNAVNQGGEAGGTRIPAGFYSGDFRAMKQHKGRALTDLTIGEIMDLQADPGGSRMSNAEWVKQGKLHAVGRYQFIGKTLRGLVQRLGISRSAKFTPELQDRLFLSLLKSGGPGQWVGLRNATAQEMALIRKAQSKL
jgi:hypothetical protein